MAQYAQYGLEAAANIPENAILANWLDPWPSPFHKAVEISGYGGLGVDWPHFFSLFYTSVPMFIVFIILSLILKKRVFPRLGVALGISKTNKKKQRKFANQLWLFCFYTGNTILGYIAQRDKKWFAVPLTFGNVREMFVGFPSEPEPIFVLYYSTSFAFYTSELLSLFVETKRSDFMEYVVHHIATIILFVMSWGGRDHPMGSYVIFLHDASDIFLSLAKSLHYVNMEVAVNSCFAVFIAGFMLFRFYCLPTVLVGCFYISPVMRKAAVNFYVLAMLLFFVLQLLHVFWFYLILRIILRLFNGVKGDARSDSDNDAVDKLKNKGPQQRSEGSDSKKKQ
jgi:hypothetical protein